ncbi:hypothetical protein NC651_038190 [Populus alba x Populus x berolinensis]|nr:hypothetical protein NC651_038190 [Populus alba x Populus x berolinensis]
MVGTWHLAADDTDKVTGFEEELQNARASVETPTTTLENLNQTKADVLNNLENESAMKHKLQKAEVGLQEEQKVSDPLKKRYAAAMAEKRRRYSLLRLFSGGRLGLATTRVRVLVLRIATKYNSEFSLSGLHSEQEHQRHRAAAERVCSFSIYHLAKTVPLSLSRGIKVKTSAVIFA